MVKTIEVSARFQPNCCSSGATNTLHAYSAPSARFIESPPITRHQRFSPVVCIPLWYVRPTIARGQFSRGLQQLAAAQELERLNRRASRSRCIPVRHHVNRNVRLL